MKVVIFNNGKGAGIYTNRPEDHQYWVDTLKEILKGEDTVVVATGEVDLLRKADTVIFISKANLKLAEEIKIKNPALRVILFSAIPPEPSAGIIVLSKTELAKFEKIRQIVLN